MMLEGREKSRMKVSIGMFVSKIGYLKHRMVEIT